MSEITPTPVTPAAISRCPTGVAATAAIASRIAGPPPAVDRRRPIARRVADAKPDPPVGEAPAPDPEAQRLRRQDVAFQARMRRAITTGREHPPMIGVFKDDRPLAAPRLFAPVAHASGCGSPASDCAALVAPTDGR